MSGVEWTRRALRENIGFSVVFIVLLAVNALNLHPFSGLRSKPGMAVVAFAGRPCDSPRDRVQVASRGSVAH